MAPDHDVTLLLQRWDAGDPAAMQSLMPLIYEQLHNIAIGYMRHERGDHTLQPTALVNEVYLKLLGQRRFSCNDRGHFFTFAARLMRNILKDHARARLAEKRGGTETVRLPLSEDLSWVGGSPESIIDLNSALDRLETLDRRKAQLVELRFFLALSMDEIADVLNVSVATAERDLRFSRSWLYRELTPQPAAQDLVH